MSARDRDKDGIDPYLRCTISVVKVYDSEVGLGIRNAANNTTSTKEGIVCRDFIIGDVGARRLDVEAKIGIHAVEKESKVGGQCVILIVCIRVSVDSLINIVPVGAAAARNNRLSPRIEGLSKDRNSEQKQSGFEEGHHPAGVQWKIAKRRPSIFYLLLVREEFECQASQSDGCADIYIR